MLYSFMHIANLQQQWNQQPNLHVFPSMGNDSDLQIDDCNKRLFMIVKTFLLLFVVIMAEESAQSYLVFS